MERFLDRKRRRTAAPSRSRSISGGRRRHRSSSSERDGHSDRDRMRQGRRHLEKRSADRSKNELMKQHEALHELQRRFDSSIDKLAYVEADYRGNYGSRNSEKNAWTYLVVSTSVVMAAVVASRDHDVPTIPSVYDQAPQSSSMYWTALSLCIVLLLLSLFKTASMFRDQYYHTSRSQPLIALIISSMGVIFQGIINSILLGRDNYFAMAGLSIASQNMFYGCWVSFGLLSYLLGSAASSVFYNEGTVLEARFKSNSSNWPRRRQFGKLMTVLWTMHLLFQLCVMSASISVQTSPICSGILRSTTSCRGVSAALILSVLNLPTCLVCLLNIFSFLRLDDALAVKLYGLCASLSLLFQAISTGTLTSLGGLGSNPGNLFISSWANTLLCLIIVLRCIEGYLAVNLPLDELETPSDETFEKIIAFPAQPSQQSALIRTRSRRTSETPSTDVSDDEEEFMIRPQLEQQGASGSLNASTASAHLLALPAPERETNPRTNSVNQEQIPMPPPPPPPRPLPQEPQTRFQEPTQSTNSPKRARSSRCSTFISTLHRSVAPQPPPFREPPTRQGPPRLSNAREMRSTFMEPISEVGERRRSIVDPPCSNPGSIQDAAYYHSSRDITLPSPGSDVDGIATQRRAHAGMSKSSSGSTFDKVKGSPRKIRTGKDPSVTQPTVNSIGNEVTSVTTEDAPSVSQTRRKSKSPAATRKATSVKAASSYSSDDSSAYIRTERRSINAASRGNSLVQGQSASEESSVLQRKSIMSSSKQTTKKSFDTSSAASSQYLDDSKRPTVNADIFLKMTASIDIPSDDDLEFYEQSLPMGYNDNRTASSHSGKSSLMKNIDDYITDLPNINPDGLRSSLSRQFSRQNSSLTSKTSSLTKPLSSRDVSKTNSFNQSTSTDKFKPFTSRDDHKTAVAAALLAAGSMPSPSKNYTQETEVSGHSPVTSDDEDDDSGVETVSTDSDRASLHSFDFKDTDKVPNKKPPEKSHEAQDFLDFEYRPRASAQNNMNASFSRRQILSYFDPSLQEAPMNTIHMEDGSLVSEPTIDHSIRTAKKSTPPEHSQVDEFVRAALDKASEMRRSKKRMSIGAITVEGHNVNDIVQAALNAASEERSKKTPNSTLPSTSSKTRHQKKKSLSSNFSSDLINQVCTSVSSSAMKKMQGSIYGESESGSFAQC